MKLGRNRRKGQAIVEYIIIIVIVAVSALTVLGLFRDRVRPLLAGVAPTLRGPNPPPPGGGFRGWAGASGPSEPLPQMKMGGEATWIRETFSAVKPPPVKKVPTATPSRKVPNAPLRKRNISNVLAPKILPAALRYSKENA